MKLTVLLLTLAVATPAAAQTDAVAYLRRLSLDLRGVTPTLDELHATVQAGEVAPAVIDAMLASPEFVERTVRAHRELLWPGLSVVLFLGHNTLTYFEQDGLRIFYAGDRAPIYRNSQNPCLPTPATFDGSGRLITTNGREGYVDVQPYWAPETTIHVCGFDAQAAVTSAAGLDCGARNGISDPGCGCGPDLVWCISIFEIGTLTDALTDAIQQDVAYVIANDRPYTEMLTASWTHMNGRVAHFWRYLRNFGAEARFDPAPMSDDSLPAIAYTDTTWHKVEVGPWNSGILTHVAYLVRFPTRRARASRFYDAFMCQPFMPPAAGLPAADDQCNTETDLQVRCGCSACHARLEPSASYWGRWPEGGAGYLAPDAFPTDNAACKQCVTNGIGCTEACGLYYVTSTVAPVEQQYVGELKAMLYRRPEHVSHIDDGPRALVAAAVQNDTLGTCTVQRAVTRLLNRDLDDGDGRWLEDVAQTFAAENQSYRAMVRAIVTSDVYRGVQ